MTDQPSFRDGYIEGWKTVLGIDAAPPLIPSFFVPGGKTPRQVGLVRGMEDAKKRQGRR